MTPQEYQATIHRVIQICPQLTLRGYKDKATNLENYLLMAECHIKDFEQCVEFLRGFLPYWKEPTPASDLVAALGPRGYGRELYVGLMWAAAISLGCKPIKAAVNHKSYESMVLMPPLLTKNGGGNA